MSDRSYDEPLNEDEPQPDQPSERTANGHTVGPWHIGIIEEHISITGREIVGNGQQLAVVYLRPEAEQEANARLIAAAPRGYALAELIERTLGGYFSGQKTDTVHLHQILESAREFMAQVQRKS